MSTLSLAGRLGLSVPLVQAPMAGVSTPALAAAVCEAGALGSLGLGAMSVEEARNAIEQTREGTRRPFNVNVFTHRSQPLDEPAESAWLDRLRPFFARFDAQAPERLAEIYKSFNEDDAMLGMLCALRPAVVSFHFGLPSPDAVSRLKTSGAFLMGSATSVREAKALEERGMDAVVAQGFDAGGHRGVFDGEDRDEELALDTLLPRILDAIDIPVIAAGGLMGGADIARTLRAGASAAQLGTAFVGCPESAAGLHYRRRLADAGSDDTRMTRALSGRRARGLTTPLIEALSPHEHEAPAYPYSYDAAKRLAAAALARGDPDFGAFWAGTQAHLARALPAGELVGLLAQELASARA